MDTEPGRGKKILVFSQHFWPEEFRINDLCKGLSEQGFSVDVVCGIPNYPSGKIYKGWGFFKRKREVWNGVNIRRVWEIPRGNNKLCRILLNFISWPLFCLFCLPFIRGKYDRVFMYQLSPVFMALPSIIYRYFTKTPLIIYILDYWPFSVFAVLNIKNQFLQKIITKLSQWHYKKADGIIGAFERIPQMLIDDVGLEKERTIYIPQACEKLHETNIYDENLHKKYNKYFCIVFTGSINPAQAFDVIIPAAKLCYDAGYHDIHWVIVGDGLSREEVEDMVLQTGLANNFHFEGFHPVEDMPKYYGIADAFIVALKKSQLGDFGVPAKIQSYFAAGKPILGAMDGDAADLINDNEVGFCGPSDNPRVLCKNICKVYHMTKDDRDAMGERAKLFYFECFERDKQLKRLISFMLNILSKTNK